MTVPGWPPSSLVIPAHAECSRLHVLVIPWLKCLQVCLAGSTDVCDLTDENGVFTLTVAGDLAAPVCLEITGSNFSASLCLPFAIPARSAVQISNITCPGLGGAGGCAMSRG